jgi:hypothetical protein
VDTLFDPEDLLDAGPAGGEIVVEFGTGAQQADFEPAMTFVRTLMALVGN